MLTSSLLPGLSSDHFPPPPPYPDYHSPSTTTSTILYFQTHVVHVIHSMGPQPIHQQLNYTFNGIKQKQTFNFMSQPTVRLIPFQQIQ